MRSLYCASSEHGVVRSGHTGGGASTGPRRTVTTTSYRTSAACHSAWASALNFPAMGSVCEEHSGDTMRPSELAALSSGSESCLGATSDPGDRAGVVSLLLAPHPRHAPPSITA